MKAFDNGVEPEGVSLAEDGQDAEKSLCRGQVKRKGRRESKRPYRIAGFRMEGNVVDKAEVTL